MLKIKIAQREFPYLNALEQEEFYNGSSRRTMTVTCAPDAIGLDPLNDILTEDNLKAIQMTNEDEGITNTYDGYVLKLECGIKAVQVERETPETPARYEDRLVFKLGRRTYIEQALHDLGIE